MSWFYFPRKKIVLDFFTDRPQVFNYAPVKKASAFLPEWWKNIPSSVYTEDGLHPHPTMKHCVGFSEMYKHGVILPMWSDLAVRVGEIGTTDYLYKYSDGRSVATQHNPNQWGEYYHPTEYQHLKLESPWFCRTKSEVNFIFNTPVWNQKNIGEICFLPGVINYKYQNGTNINLFIKRKEVVSDYLIPFNQPLVHITPLSEKKLDIRLHLISTPEFKNLTEYAVSSTFIKKYSTHKKIMETSGCPFHFKSEK